MPSVAVFPAFSLLIKASSMASCATQPFGRHWRKLKRPASALSIRKLMPGGSSTPSGAMTRMRRVLRSAVLSTITTRIKLGRAWSTTLSTIAHCSWAAPGGVSQRVAQSPCLSLTAPCGSDSAAETWDVASSRPPTRLRSAQPAFDRFALVNAIVGKNPLYRVVSGARVGKGGRLAAVAENRRKDEAKPELGD